VTASAEKEQKGSIIKYKLVVSEAYFTGKN
jgi:hypothetical protein